MCFVQNDKLHTSESLNFLALLWQGPFKVLMLWSEFIKTGELFLDTILAYVDILNSLLPRRYPSPPHHNSLHYIQNSYSDKTNREGM